MTETSEEKGRRARMPPDMEDRMDNGAGEFARSQAIRAATEIARRQIEPLRLYQPTPFQEKYHSCTAKECLIQAGNQIGKSLAGFIENARAALGCDPYNKYPKRDGVMAIIGYKESHIALTIYPYLFRAGAFKIIRDEETGHWRTYHPWVPEDMAREHLAKPAPPLIPRRFIKQIHWKSKAGNVFKRVDLTTGWSIHAFSSTANPDQGFEVDLVHIDEDIINERWYSEMVARLSMREGLLRWTALPHNENDALNRVAERAETEKSEHERGGPEPTTVVVRGTIYDNPYMTEETRQENIKRWKAIGEDEYRKRALGELVTDTVRMYPTFTPDIHAVQRYAKSHEHLFKDYLNTREIPTDWCLRLYVDPGFDTAAAMLVATLPTDYELHVIVREVYQKQAVPEDVILAVKKHLSGRWLQESVMDAHGGALTSLATGERPQEVYERYMAKHKVSAVETNHRFRPGCDQHQYRETMMRERLSIRVHGIPEFIYDEEFCPNFAMEMIRFRKLKIKGEVIDKGNRAKRTHLVECAEYCAADNLPYIQPPPRRSEESRGERRARQFLEKKAKRSRQPGAVGSMSGGFVF